jgi:hypothetical protein
LQYLFHEDKKGGAKHNIAKAFLGDLPFQYGQVIKLPLQILPSMHDQSDNFDTAFSQFFFFFFNFAYKMATLLLGHIGMLIP